MKKQKEVKGFKEIQILREILHKARDDRTIIILWDFGMELKIVSQHKMKLKLDKILNKKVK